MRPSDNVAGVPEREKDNKEEPRFEEITTELFSELVKDTNTRIPESKSTPKQEKEKKKRSHPNSLWSDCKTTDRKR